MKKNHTPIPGTLFMASSHIGCLFDISQRVPEIIQKADVILCESPKSARELLKLAGVHRDFFIYSEHKEKSTLEELENALKNGKTVIYLSDQGCPTLADPGREVLKKAYALKAEIKVIPGPSALTGALSACPFQLSRFHFVGFLTQKAPERLSELKKIKETYKEPLIFFDTPYRLISILTTFQEVFGSSRMGFLALDISKPSEKYLSGSFSYLQKECEKNEVKANFVLITDWE